MVRLSQRMQALADMVTPGSVLCDVGCDHGFLPIYLVQKGTIPKGIAMDVAPGPLSAAREHIAAEGLAEKISTRLSDGLCKLQREEADCVLIAGMGGGLVLHILSESREKASDLKELILQPQSELYEVRKYLFQEGYELLEEDMVLEDGKFYPMMKVRYAGVVPENAPSVRQISSDPESMEQGFYFGSLLIRDKHPVLKQYLLREQTIQQKVLNQLDAQPSTEAIKKRRQEVKSYLDMVEKTLEEMW